MLSLTITWPWAYPQRKWRYREQQKAEGRKLCVTSCCRSEADKNCALLGYYAASGGNFLPTFRDNLTVPSSWIKNPKRKPGTLLGALLAPAGTTLPRTYHRSHSSVHNKLRTRAPGLFWRDNVCGLGGHTGTIVTSAWPRDVKYIWVMVLWGLHIQSTR